MSNDYIPHGQHCDFGLMLNSGGEWHCHKSDFEWMRNIAKEEGTHLVNVIDCEGAPFCIAPLPIARWIIRVMEKEYGQNFYEPEIKKLFESDWVGSGCPDEFPEGV